MVEGLLLHFGPLPRLTIPRPACGEMKLGHLSIWPEIGQVAPPKAHRPDTKGGEDCVKKTLHKAARRFSKGFIGARWKTASPVR